VKKKIICASLALAVFVGQPVFASTPRFSELSAFIGKAKRDTDHPSGTAVAIVKDGTVVYQGYFGFADIAGKKPVSDETVFYIASTTKPFFALNALLLAERGKIEMHTPMSTMFPNAQFNSFDAGTVTMKDLLVHGSGVENNALGWAVAYSGIHNAESRRDLVAASVANKEAGHGRFQYTNIGYNIASVWLDQKISMPWQDQLQDRIFKPLGMKHTSAHISQAQRKSWSMALPYSFVNADPNTALYLKKTDDTMQAAGGLISTAPDLAKFLIAQTSNGKLNGKTVFPEQVIAKSQQAQISTESRYLDFARSGYAWGWYIGEYKQRSMLHHFGGFAGFHAHLSFMPEERIGLVVLNNEDILSPRMTALIADYAYGLLLGEGELAERMDGRLAQLTKQAKEMQVGMAMQRVKLAEREWKLSRPMNDYLGTYQHPQLGKMKVSLNEQGKLLIRWGRLESIAGAFDNPDTVRVEFSPNSGDTLDFIAGNNSIAGLRFASATFSKLPNPR
jgi:CubicO group peptidase (beta-lactamase class C family)